MNRSAIFSSLFVVAVLVSSSLTAQEPEIPKTVRVYFIGNSVTDTINYRGLEVLAKSRGYRHVWGRHMIPGAPLQWIWQHPDQGFQEQPYGHYPTALTKYQWDVLCLQPFDRHITGDEGDIVMAKNFITMALPKSRNVQVYVYGRWPRKDQDGSLDYGTKWLRKYTGGWDGTNETKDYFERLTLELRKACPELKKPVLMVPVGHVMYGLDQQMKAGKVPGLKDVGQVYKDGIHLNNVGSYIVACTFFATLYRENPKDLTAEPYGDIDPKVAEVIHDVVWKVVSTHELAGLAKTTFAGAKTSFKGWELYVWQQDGDTYFSLMVGTNRLKTDDDIAGAAVKGIDAIKPKLDELKEGEMVFPCGRRLPDRAPDEPATEIRKYCQKLGLDVRR